MEDKEETSGGIYIGNNASTNSTKSDDSHKKEEIKLRFVIIVWNAIPKYFEYIVIYRQSPVKSPDIKTLYFVNASYLLCPC